MTLRSDLVPIFPIFICFDLVNSLTLHSNFGVRHADTRNGLLVSPMHEPRSGLVSWHDEHLRDIYVRGSRGSPYDLLSDIFGSDWVKLSSSIIMHLWIENIRGVKPL